MYSRRDFAKIALTSWPIARAWAAHINSTVNGVRLGTITYSFRDFPRTPGKDNVDAVIQALTECGIGEIELFSPNIEPGRAGGFGRGNTAEAAKAREELRQWRLTTPMEYFKDIRKKFDAAGLNLFSYVMTFDLDFTDEEIDAVFKQMQALKVSCFCTNQSRVDVAPRLIPFAEKYKIRPAWHPHAMVKDPNEVATPEGMEKLLAMSKFFAINLDIGHYTAGNNDAVDFLRKHHDRITHLHIKDRKRDGGPNVALGTGDTPIKECLTLLRDNKYPIYAIIEREYRDAPGSPAEQTKGQMEYLKQILSA